MFTLSYGGAVLIALVCGVAWDATGIPLAAFAPMAACCIALVVLALRMRRARELR